MAHKTPWSSPKKQIQQSPLVQNLEILISNLQSTTTPAPDPNGGCFCLARQHPLSPHTPLCHSCGLILCSLNPPYNLCPNSNCSSPLLSPHSLHSLHSSLSSQLAKEHSDQLNLIDQARKSAQAFPSLSSSSPPPPRPPPEPHKVLSITKNKIKLSSYHTTPTPPSRTDNAPEPPQFVIHANPPTNNKTRPWRNYSIDGGADTIKYIPNK